MIIGLVWSGAVGGCLSPVGEDLGQDVAADGWVQDVASGRLQFLVATYPDGTTETLYGLALDDGQEIALEFDFDPSPFQPEEYLELGGRWHIDKSGRTPTFRASEVFKHLGVDHAADGGDHGQPSLSDAPAADGRRPPFKHRIAVLVLGDTKYSLKQVRDQVRPTPGSAANFLGENSGGVDPFEGDAFGPFKVKTAGCDHSQIAKDAIAAARASGVNVDGYTNLAFLIPGDSGCGWGGLGQVARPGSTSQLRTWYHNWFDCSVVAHELGHNLGMKHSHSLDCGNKIYNKNSQGCEETEYGHAFDIMGNARCEGGHFSTAQKQYMGWLRDCEDVAAGGNDVFNLSPAEGSCGVRSLRIPIAGEGKFYYLEYRKRSVGEFAGAASGKNTLSDRVLLAVSTDGRAVRPDVSLLDATPNSDSRDNQDRRDSELKVNRDYDLPGGVRLRVLSMGDVAKVRVQMSGGQGARCRGGSAPAARSDGSIGVGCGVDACPGDPNKTQPGYCGCGVPDEDSDGDGTRDCEDGCRDDPFKTEPGQCGCGTLELDCGTMAPGLERSHYRGRWSSLPNFDALSADAKTIVTSIDVQDLAGTDNFGVVFTGGLRVQQAGAYQFEIGSDDGSRLRIDGRDVVVNDGLHGFSTKVGSMELSEGVHDLRVEFFESGGGERLRVRYRRSGQVYAEIPSNLLVHASDPDDGGDGCPKDPNKTEPGECGCGVPEGACDEEMRPGLRREHYRGTWNALPDFDQLQPDAEDIVDRVTLDQYANTDRFALVFTGWISIEKAGTYRFEMRSDDGSRLEIGGEQVVVRDELGLATRRGSIALTAGMHPIRVEYFEGTGGEYLRLRYRPAQGSWQALPSRLLFHSEQDVPEAAQCAEANDREFAVLRCPSGQEITAISFASYGTPRGSCGSYQQSSCHASTSEDEVKTFCMGRNSCAVPVKKGRFGDPCPGTPKRLRVAYICR